MVGSARRLIWGWFAYSALVESKQTLVDSYGQPYDPENLPRCFHLREKLANSQVLYYYDDIQKDCKQIRLKVDRLLMQPYYPPENVEFRGDFRWYTHHLISEDINIISGEELDFFHSRIEERLNILYNKGQSKSVKAVKSGEDGAEESSRDGGDTADVEQKPKLTVSSDLLKHVDIPHDEKCFTKVDFNLPETEYVMTFFEEASLVHLIDVGDHENIEPDRWWTQVRPDDPRCILYPAGHPNLREEL